VRLFVLLPAIAETQDEIKSGGQAKRFSP
jgi:hypothetical protein